MYPSGYGRRSPNKPGSRSTRVCWIPINRHLQAVEVTHGIEPRGPRSLVPPKYLRAGHPPMTFLGFADGLRALLREAADWSAKTPASAVTPRAQQAPSTKPGSACSATRSLERGCGADLAAPAEADVPLFEFV